MDPARLTAFSGLRTLPGGAPGAAPAVAGMPGFALDLPTAPAGEGVAPPGTVSAASLADGSAVPAAAEAVLTADGRPPEGMAGSLAPEAGVAAPSLLARLFSRPGAAVQTLPEVAAPATEPVATSAVTEMPPADAEILDEAEPVAASVSVPVAAVPPQGDPLQPVSAAAVAGSGDDGDADVPGEATMTDAQAVQMSRSPRPAVAGGAAGGGFELPAPPDAGLAAETADGDVPYAAIGAQGPLPAKAAGPDARPGAGPTDAPTGRLMPDSAVVGTGPTASRGADAAATGAGQHPEIPGATASVAPVRQALSPPEPLVPVAPAAAHAPAGASGGDTVGSAPSPVAMVADEVPANVVPAPAPDDAGAVMRAAGAAPSGRTGTMRMAAGAPSTGDGAEAANLQTAGTGGLTVPLAAARPAAPVEGGAAPAAAAGQDQPLPAEAAEAEYAAEPRTGTADDGLRTPGKAAGETVLHPEPVARIAATPPAPVADNPAAVAELPQPAPPAQSVAQAEAALPGGAADGATALDAAWRQMVLDVQKQGWTQALVRRVAGLASTGGTLAVQVYPPALGRMVIRVSETTRGLDLRVSSELAATAAMMGEAEQRISQLLESSGLRLADYSSQTGGAGADGRGEGGNGPRQTADDAAPAGAPGPRAPADDPAGAPGTPAGANGRVDLIA